MLYDVLSETTEDDGWRRRFAYFPINWGKGKRLWWEAYEEKLPKNCDGPYDANGWCMVYRRPVGSKEEGILCCRMSSKWNPGK